MTAHLPACRARSGKQEGRGGAEGRARTGTHPDGSVEGGPAWGIPHGRRHPRRPYRGGDRVAPGVIAECPEPHRGGSTPLSLLSGVTTCPLHPALLEATLFTTPRPLADVWRHLWLPAGVKGSSVQWTEVRDAAGHWDAQDSPHSKKYRIPKCHSEMPVGLRNVRRRNLEINKADPRATGPCRPRPVPTSGLRSIRPCPCAQVDGL